MNYSDITRAIARTLWLCAYADSIENGEVTGPRPGLREDWDDYAVNRWAPEGLADVAAHWCRLTGLDVAQFGHTASLQAQGHGVSLCDYVPLSMGYKSPELPPLEFYLEELPKGCQWAA